MVFLVLLRMLTFSQVFPEPTGNSATDPDDSKDIGTCQGTTATGYQAIKTNTVARRYSYGLAIWNELYQVKGKKFDICSPNFNCTSCSDCEEGWNKIGRITFIRNNDANNNKLHVGWRADPNNDHQLKMSAYFHEVDWGKKEWPDYFVSHYITNVHTDTEPYIDMFMSLETIAMIINEWAVVMRKPGMIPDNKQTYLARTFYFQEPYKCVSKQKMKIEFRNQHYDWSGFPEALNMCKYITVNISEFKSGDEHTFYAYKEMYGSISNENLGYVQYEAGHPNPVKQKCIISSGADITFSAGESVFLYPGFYAAPGSHFVAEIIQKEKYPGYYDEPKKLNLPPLEQGECSIINRNSEAFYSDTENSENIQYIEEILTEQQFYRLYPNPHPGIFTINWNGESISQYSIQVMNIMGHLVYERKNLQQGITQVDISTHPKGIYFVKLQAGDKVFTEKVIYQ